MKVLVTGKGTSGSWQCRGVQLGGEIGRVKANATLDDCKKADLIVVVKRINAPFFNNVLRSGKPWVWDLVDFYPQPSPWNRDQAIEWVNAKIKKAKPTGIIWPNRQMQQDCGGDGVVIYHHGRAVTPSMVRKDVKTVGYEGSPKFLGRWRGLINDECAKRGWEFKERCPMSEMDIVVAFRDGAYAGYVPTHWKSNVKLANAHMAGVPFVGQPEASYLETATGKEKWVISKELLSMAFDELTPYRARLETHCAFIKNRFTLQSRADQVRQYVEKLSRD